MVQVKVEHLIVLLIGLFLLHYFMCNCERRVEGFDWKAMGTALDVELRQPLENDLYNIPSLIPLPAPDVKTGVRGPGQCCDSPSGYIMKLGDGRLDPSDNTICKPGLHCLFGGPKASNNSCPQPKSGKSDQAYYGSCNRASTLLDAWDPGNKPP